MHYKIFRYFVVISLLTMVTSFFVSIYYGKKQELAYIKNLAISKNDVDTSPFDERSYKSYKLKNGLEVLIVYDPKLIGTQVSLSIDAGSYQDPKDFKGLAYITQKTLFTGELSSNFKDFIKFNGGKSDFTISPLYSNFSFSTKKKNLTVALNRFVNILSQVNFIDHKLKKENIIFSLEYLEQLKNSPNKNATIISILSNINHPSYFKFKKILLKKKQNLAKIMQEFFNNFYNPQKMKLVIIAGFDIKDIQSLLQNNFAKLINNNNYNNKNINYPLYDIDATLPRITFVQDKNSLPNLFVRFQISSFVEFKKSHPEYFILNVLNYQGKASLYQYLQKKGWIYNLDSSFLHEFTQTQKSKSALLDVNMQLTKKGLENWQTIFALLMNVIDFVKSVPIDIWRIEEIQQIAKLKFLFSKNFSAKELAIKLTKLTTKEILNYSLMDNLNSTRITSFVKKITMNNSQIIVNGNFKKLTKEKLLKSPIFNKNYKNDFFTAEDLSNWRSKISSSWYQHFSLPSKNIFIAKELLENTSNKNTSLSKDKNNIQKIITKAKTFWFIKQTDSSAKGIINFKLLLPANIDPVFGKLYTMILKQKIISDTSTAIIANYKIKIKTLQNAVSISIYGMKSQLANILSVVINNILYLKITEQELINFKDKYVYEQNKSKNTYLQLSTKLHEILTNSPNPVANLVKKISQISIEDFLFTIKNKIQIISIISGNYSDENKQKFIELINKLHSSAIDNIPINRVYKLNKSYYTNIKKNKNNNKAILLYLQAKDNKPKTGAVFLLLNEIMPLYFNKEFKYKKKLAFISTVKYQEFAEIPGLLFYLQSTKNNENKLSTSIINFINTSTILENVFLKMQKSLIYQLKQNATNLAPELNNYWSNIYSYNSNFNNQELLIKEIRNLKFIDILHTLDYLANSAKKILITTTNKRIRIKGFKAIKNLKKESNLI